MNRKEFIAQKQNELKENKARFKKALEKSKTKEQTKIKDFKNLATKDKWDILEKIARDLGYIE